MRIKSTRYRGEDGFLLYGKDPSGRSLSVFHPSKRILELARVEYKAGREWTFEELKKKMDQHTSKTKSGVGGAPDDEFDFIVVEDVSLAPDDPKFDVSWYETEQEARKFAGRMPPSHNVRVYMEI